MSIMTDRQDKGPRPVATSEPVSSPRKARNGQALALVLVLLAALSALSAVSLFVLGEIAYSLVPGLILAATTVLAGAVALAASRPRSLVDTRSGRLFLAAFLLEIVLLAMGLPTLRVSGSQMGWPLVAFILTGWLPAVCTAGPCRASLSARGKAAWAATGVALLGLWLYVALMLLLMSMT